SFLGRSCRGGDGNGSVSGRGLQIVFQVGLDDGYLGPVNYLDAVPLVDHTGSAALLEQVVLDQGRVMDSHPEPGGAAVQVGQVGLATQTGQNQGGNGVLPGGSAGGIGAYPGLLLEVGTGVELGLLPVGFPAGGLQVKLPD